MWDQRAEQLCVWDPFLTRYFAYFLPPDPKTTLLSRGTAHFDLNSRTRLARIWSNL